jgi:hypothetical protein
MVSINALEYHEFIITIHLTMEFFYINCYHSFMPQVVNLNLQVEFLGINI